MSIDVVLLTVSEAAAILRLGKTKVYELCRTNELPVVRIGKTIRIPKNELLQYLKKKMQFPKAS